MKRSEVIRVGDEVRVVTLTVVTRVGYPKCLADYLPEAERLFLPALQPVLDQVLLKKFIYGEWDPKSQSYKRVMFEFAHMLAKKDGFGGDERTLHTVECPELKDAMCYVEEVKTRYTGTRVPPSYSHDSYYGEDAYEPGGLAHSKCHRLVRVLVMNQLRPVIVPNTYGIWLQVKDVEKVVEKREAA